MELSLPPLGLVKSKENWLFHSGDQYQTVRNCNYPECRKSFAGQVAGLNVSNPPGMQQNQLYLTREL